MSLARAYGLTPRGIRSNLPAHMVRGHALTCFVLVLTTSTAVAGVGGCKRDLGECNLDGQTSRMGSPISGPAALDIAYHFTDGLPMYEGQALVQSTCGNGQFCHSPAAVGGDRIGVPAGLNFDVALACTDETQDPSCAQPIQELRWWANQHRVLHTTSNASTTTRTRSTSLGGGDDSGNTRGRDAAGGSRAKRS